MYDVFRLNYVTRTYGVLTLIKSEAQFAIILGIRALLSVSLLLSCQFCNTLQNNIFSFFITRKFEKRVLNHSCMLQEIVTMQF